MIYFRLLLIFVAALLGVSFACEQYNRINLDKVAAAEYAVALFSDVCRDECAGRGYIMSQFKGPIESPINFDRNTRDFEFYWVSFNGARFGVSISDNGIFISENYWWDQVDWHNSMLAPPAE